MVRDGVGIRGRVKLVNYSLITVLPIATSQLALHHGLVRISCLL